MTTFERIAAVAVSVLLALLSSCSISPPAGDTSSAYDLLIVNGTIVDGTGAAPYQGDIAIVGDKIARIGDLAGSSATRIVDAGGSVVSPVLLICTIMRTETSRPARVL